MLVSGTASAPQGFRLIALKSRRLLPAKAWGPIGGGPSGINDYVSEGDASSVNVGCYIGRHSRTSGARASYNRQSPTNLTAFLGDCLDVPWVRSLRHGLWRAGGREMGIVRGEKGIRAGLRRCRRASASAPPPATPLGEHEPPQGPVIGALVS